MILCWRGLTKPKGSLVFLERVSKHARAATVKLRCFYAQSSLCHLTVAWRDWHPPQEITQICTQHDAALPFYLSVLPCQSHFLFYSFFLFTFPQIFPPEFSAFLCVFPWCQSSLSETFPSCTLKRAESASLSWAVFSTLLLLSAHPFTKPHPALHTLTKLCKCLCTSTDLQLCADYHTSVVCLTVLKINSCST